MKTQDVLICIPWASNIHTHMVTTNYITCGLVVVTLQKHIVRLQSMKQCMQPRTLKANIKVNKFLQVKIQTKALATGVFRGQKINHYCTFENGFGHFQTQKKSGHSKPVNSLFWYTIVFSSRQSIPYLDVNAPLGKDYVGSTSPRIEPI